MSNTQNDRGAFSWNELMTTDPEAAKSFYQTLFGWTYEEMKMEDDMTYEVVSVNGRQIGGIMPQCKETVGMPPAWGPYVTVEDVDATAEQARNLGAQLLVEPRDIPAVGRFCVIQDPQGAVLSVITPLAV